MILKPTKKGIKNLIETEEKEVLQAPKQKRSKGVNTLPPDEYRPLFEPIRFLVKETRSMKDPMSVVKQYLEISVKRYKDDYENAPTVYIQMCQESDLYTGYLKGKSVHLPLEMLYDLIEYLEEVSEKSDKIEILGV